MDTTYTDRWRANFRYGDNFRKGQDKAIEAIARELDAGRKFVIAELPTGLGKSDCAMALAKSAPDKAFITTSQNILIDQYCNDFLGSPGFYLIKGRKHYECISSYKNCEDGIQAKCYYAKQHSNPESDDKGKCAYKRERDLAIMSPVTLTNTTYFALACNMADLWSPRSLAIIDEAHNIANEIMNLTSMVITDRVLHRMQIARTIPFDLCQSKEVSLDRFRKYLEDLKFELSHTIPIFEKTSTSGDIIDNMKTLLQKISWFEDSLDKGVEWIVDYDQDSSKNDRLTARPIDTSYFASNLFFSHQADQYVMQSATIVDFKQYAAELGIECGTGIAYKYGCSSPFDLTRSPVYPLNIGNMNRDNINATLPKIAGSIENILKRRHSSKGLVHTHTDAIHEFLRKIFASNPRCIFHKNKFHDGISREAAMKLHFSSKEPTVLFSPSMTEGVDGKDDWLRFQIICKVPYPDLGDRRINIKANRSWSWYNYQTAKTIIQAKGRGMRGEKDWCETFMLDSGFDSFTRRAKLPKDFADCIKSNDDGIKALSSSPDFGV